MYRLTDLISSDELYHHGIKGQKWGRRRFQNEDGSLTPAGKERYDDDGPSEKKKEYKIPENKSTHRLKLEEKFEAQGMTRQQAEQAAARRIRGEQYAVAAAAVTVTACIAYNKYKNYNVDKTISTEQQFQRILKTNEPNAPIRKGARYVSYDKKDNKKYAGIYGGELLKRKTPDEEIYKMAIKSKGDIKVASEKRARETFANLYKNDPEFKKNFVDRAIDNRLNFIAKPNLTRTMDDIQNNKSLSDKQLKKHAYDMFNVMLVDSEEKGRSNANKFYEALKKQGVQAINDMNDKKYSGYNAKSPLILFDGDFEYTKRVMNTDEVQAMMKKETNKLVTEGAVKYGATFAGLYASQPIMDRRALDKQVILYKREHPNTRMSDSEIRKMLKKQNEEQ